MEKYIENYSENRRMKKVVFGIIVAVVGVLLMASNFGYLPYHLRHIFFSWQMLLIAIGIINLVSHESKTLGVILISVGTFFLLPDIFVFSFNFVKLFWPMLLIGVGLSLIFLGRRSPHWKHRRMESRLEEGFLFETNIFGGSKRIIVEESFKGGEINNIFGGSELDFTQSKLAVGKNVLDVSCIFGGMAILVPADWNVRLEVTSIFGGFSDKRFKVIKPDDDSKVLIIKGSCVFGGGEIKSF